MFSDTAATVPTVIYLSKWQTGNLQKEKLT